MRVAKASSSSAPVVKDIYYKWLLDTIDDPELYDVNDYTILMVALFNVPFRWKIDMDENRAEDGAYLRYIFEEDNNYDASSLMDLPCSVLEMLIALAIRWDEELMSEQGNSARWFWLMLENLGLVYYPDSQWSEKEVLYILDVFLDRKYCKDGSNGNIFVLFSNSKTTQGVKKTTQDVRKIEIWYQLQAYILENFGF